ncbi:MAG: galactokinase [Sedimentisphaerales bacterium]|nr:galactokinase [Sedimentisphaerales bacterium]
MNTAKRESRFNFNKSKTVISEKLLADFQAVYGAAKPDFICRAPGRVELVGGHTDYNQGFVIAAAINHSCFVAASKRSDRRISIYSDWAKQKHTFVPSKNLQPLTNCQWANYSRGLAALLSKHGLKLKGANLYISSEIPVGAGLSSSAALEVSLAKAMVTISDPNWDIEPSQLARICRQAENDFANSPCGIMDQIACIMGRKDQVIILDCRDLSVEFLPFDSKNCCIMIFNSMIRHEIAGTEYSSRRQQCEKACQILHNINPKINSLRDVNLSVLNQAKGKLGPTLFSRASHVINENMRVLKAAQALKKNDMLQLGKLMKESHRSARDLFQISCEQTDFLVDKICQIPGAYGARITGGGFGGAVVALAQPEAVQEITKSVKGLYRKRFGLNCKIYLSEPSQGVELINVANS